VPLQKRIKALEALTDPCGPDHFDTEYPVDHRALTCDRCGGVGRVARNQPETERVTFSPRNKMFGNRFAAHIVAMTDLGGSASKALYEQFSLTMVEGSGSWEKEATSNE